MKKRRFIADGPVISGEIVRSPINRARGGIPMAQDPTSKFRSLEGRRVGVTLADGTRIDDCQLISAPRPGLLTVWLLLGDGDDAFVPLSAILEVWAVSPADPPRAA